LVFYTKDYFHSLFELVLKTGGLRKLTFIVLGSEILLICEEFFRYKNMGKSFSYNQIINDYSKEIPHIVILIQLVIVFILCVFFYKYIKSFNTGLEVKKGCLFLLNKNNENFKKSLTEKDIEKVVLESNQMMLSFEGDTKFSITLSEVARKKLLKLLVEECSFLKEKIFTRSITPNKEDGSYYIKLSSTDL
jgi:hypothetical protein